MAVLSCIDKILNRRSIRKYKREPVPEDVKAKIIEAGRQAPSAANRQPWHFIVVRDRNTLLEVPKFHNYSKMLEQAALAIVVCGDLEIEGGTGFWVQDCSAATENILLAAKAAGLGAVWLGVHPNEALVKGLRGLLGIPERIMPLCIISIGHPLEEKPPGNRYRDDRVHTGKW